MFQNIPKHSKTRSCFIRLHPTASDFIPPSWPEIAAGNSSSSFFRQRFWSAIGAFTPKPHVLPGNYCLHLGFIW